MPEKDAIIIIGGGLLQIPAVEAAHSLGLAALVTDRNPHAPAVIRGHPRNEYPVADASWAIDTYDVEAHLNTFVNPVETMGYNIRGVFTEGADVEVTVAAVANALGLPGISIEAAKNCKNKIRMRECFDRVGLSPVNWISMINPYLFKPPCIIKPSDNCASRGTHIILDNQFTDAAVIDAIANSTDGRWLIEELLEGPQQSVEILFDSHGLCHWLNIVDRPFNGVIELGHINPSNLPELDRIALFQLAERAAAAVGVHFGAFKCDTIWTKDGPRILECTARLSGGFDCQYTTPMATGRNFIRAAMKIAIGRDDIEEDLQITKKRYAACWAAFPKPGIVRAIEERALGDATLGTAIAMRVKPGDVIEPYEHCAGRPAFCIADSDTYESAIERAKAGAAALERIIITE